MQAMGEVKGKRKLEAAGRKAEKEQHAALKQSAAVSEGKPPLKRPAAVKLEPSLEQKPTLKQKPPPKRPAAAKLEPSLEQEPTLKQKPPLKRPAAAAPTAAKGRLGCPPEDATEVTHYKGGKVYNSVKRKAFRAMRCATDYYTETSAS